MPIPSRAERNVSPGELQWLTLIFNRPRMLLRVLWPERILWSIVTVLWSLHWLPISKRVAYKVLSLTSQYLRETAPRYLQEPGSPYTPSRSLRSSSQCRSSTCGFSENANKNHLWIQWEQTKTTCGFSQNTCGFSKTPPVGSVRTQTKQNLWIQREHKQKAPVVSVRTQTKNLWIQWEQTKKTVDSVITRTKNTCGFCENTKKKYLWIKWEHKKRTPVDTVRTQNTPVDSVRTQTKNTCGFSQNTNKKHLWIQSEHKQKTPVDSVRTQTKITQAQGRSAVLRPPYGTGCQTLHNTQDVAFSAVAEILFLTLLSPTSLLIPLTGSLFPQYLLHPSPYSYLPSLLTLSLSLPPHPHPPPPA